MTLYIYRVGWTYPARNPITDLNLQRVLVVLGFQVDRSDRSDLTGQTGRCCQTGYMVQTGQTAQKHRSDRSVRPVPILVVNIRKLRSVGSDDQLRPSAQADGSFFLPIELIIN